MTPDTFLPALDLAQFADEARKMMGYKMFYAGFGIIGLGLVGKQVANLLRVMINKEADFITPMVVAVGFLALLASYKIFVMTTIATVSKLGLAAGWDDNIVTTFVTRAATFDRWRHEHGSMKSAIMEFTVGVLYILVEAWVVFMRAAQTFVLAVIITYGPLLLGLASLGGLFVPLGIGWFMALVEISAWSVTMDILLLAYAKVTRVPTVEELSLVDEFKFSACMLGLLFVIPAITSWLVRGSSGAVVSSGISTATQATTLIATNRFSRAANMAVYDTAKGGVKSGFGWARDRLGGGGTAANASPASAWKAADAINSHRESRATASRSQGGSNPGKGR
jgi:hypothetical protein